ncbi:MAG: LLM class flavin-dependent oxidoreductase [Dehalococcoidia bacterium]
MSKFGLLFFPRSPETVVNTTRLMEELGYDLLGLADTPGLAMDVYVGLTLAAVNTSRLMLGPCVTNPVTRDLSVTASAIASVDVVSGGRAYLGISGGFSGVNNLGVRPAPTSAMARVVPSLRDLTAGRVASIDGRTVRIPGSQRPVPIYITASGPKGLRIGGRVADGVIMHVGLLPEVVQDAMEYVRQGAQEVGRDWREVEIWVLAVASCSEDGQAARNSLKGAVGSVAAYIFSPNTQGKHLPPELEEPVVRLRRGYSATDHLQPGPSRNLALVEELGLADYLLERFAFAGTPEECRQKLLQLEAIGVDKFIFSISASPNVEQDARMLAQALNLSGSRS